MRIFSPYKDISVRGIILFLWVSLLLALNFLFLVIISYSSYLLVYFLFLCLLWLVYRRSWKVYSTLQYQFEWDVLKIISSWKKIASWKKSDVRNIEYVDGFSKDSFVFRWWVYMDWLDLHARLAYSSLLKITLHTSDEVYLSLKQSDVADFKELLT